MGRHLDVQENEGRGEGPPPVGDRASYIAETQDEKMYRVVVDRERWFSVVMGNKFATDARTTEGLAARIPLPDCVAEPLA